jgi:hypothetical protein
VLKRIIKNNLLEDTYRTKFPNKKTSTYTRIEEKKIIASRIDYILALKENTTWFNPRILKISPSLSKDHKAIGITIIHTMKKGNTPKPKSQIEKRMYLEDLTEENITKIIQITENTFNTSQ